MSEWFGKNTRPESERMIECKGHDWSEFKCTGKFIDYKPEFFRQKGNRNKPKNRFCTEFSDGLFISDKKTWDDVTEWRYLSNQESC